MALNVCVWMVFLQNFIHMSQFALNFYLFVQIVLRIRHRRKGTLAHVKRNCLLFAHISMLSKLCPVSQKCIFCLELHETESLLDQPSTILGGIGLDFCLVDSRSVEPESKQFWMVEPEPEIWVPVQQT